MEKFSQPFEGSNTEPGKVAVAFYAGIFSYSGWLVYSKKKVNNNTKLVNELLCGSVSFVILKLGAVVPRVLRSVSLRRLLYAPKVWQIYLAQNHILIICVILSEAFEVLTRK